MVSEFGLQAAPDTDSLRQFLAEHREQRTPWSSARVFATIFRRNIKLAECPSFGQSVFDYAPSSHGAQDYAALALELLAPPSAAKTTVTGRAARPTEDAAPSDPAAFAPPAPAHKAPAPAGLPAAGPQP
jgi:chromosome partitioning protein